MGGGRIRDLVAHGGWTIIITNDDNNGLYCTQDKDTCPMLQLS